MPKPIEQSQKNGTFTRKKVILAFTACAIAITIFVVNNYGYVFVQYYKYLFAGFKPGDKVYLDEKLIDRKSHGTSIYRLVRPLTEKEIDAMYLFADETAKAKSYLNPGSKPYVCNVHVLISFQKLRQQKSGLIGVFLSQHLLATKDLDEKDVTGLFYVIKLNNAVLDTLPEPLPKGYTLADSLIYIPWPIASKKESIKF